MKVDFLPLFQDFLKLFEGVVHCLVVACFWVAEFVKIIDEPEDSFLIGWGGFLSHNSHILVFEGFSLKSLFYFVSAFFEGFKSIIGEFLIIQKGENDVGVVGLRKRVKHTGLFMTFAFQVLVRWFIIFIIWEDYIANLTPFKWSNRMLDLLRVIFWNLFFLKGISGKFVTFLYFGGVQIGALYVYLGRLRVC